MFRTARLDWTGSEGSDERILDAYRPPARDDSRPAVIIVHGGAWVERSKDEWANDLEAQFFGGTRVEVLGIS